MEKTYRSRRLVELPPFGAAAYDTRVFIGDNFHFVDARAGDLVTRQIDVRNTLGDEWVSMLNDLV